MNKTSKKSFFGRLLDKNDTSTSLSSCLIVLIMLMASLLLFLVIFSIGIEAWYNHTVASDINGWSLFVGRSETGHDCSLTASRGKGLL